MKTVNTAEVQKMKLEIEDQLFELEAKLGLINEILGVQNGKEAEKPKASTLQTSPRVAPQQSKNSTVPSRTAVKGSTSPARTIKDSIMDALKAGKHNSSDIVEFVQKKDGFAKPSVVATLSRMTSKTKELELKDGNYKAKKAA